MHGLVGEVKEGLAAVAVEEHIEALGAVAGCSCGAARDARCGGELGGGGGDLVADWEATGGVSTIQGNFVKERVGGTDLIVTVLSRIIEPSVATVMPPAAAAVAPVAAPVAAPPFVAFVLPFAFLGSASTEADSNSSPATETARSHEAFPETIVIYFDDRNS